MNTVYLNEDAAVVFYVQAESDDDVKLNAMMDYFLEPAHYEACVVAPDGSGSQGETVTARGDVTDGKVTLVYAVRYSCSVEGIYRIKLVFKNDCDCSCNTVGSFLTRVIKDERFTYQISKIKLIEV